MNYVHSFLISFILILWSSIAFGKGCEYDDQCRSGRICENGRCVSEGSSGGDKDGGVRQTQLPNYCCTMAGRYGPFANPNPMGQSVPEGGTCWAMTNFGQQMGQACY